MTTLEISSKNFGSLGEEKRSEQFLAACRNPSRWLDRALIHKRGADIIYDSAYKAFERNLARLLKEKQGDPSPRSTSRTLEGDELEDFHEERLSSEYLILIGHALECLLKGYLLAIIPELVVDEKRLDKLVANHNLNQLSHDCSIQLSPEEERLMSLIGRYITWGKYTAPLCVEDMPSWIHPDDQKEKSLAIANPYNNRNLQVAVDSIFSRASATLEAECRKTKNLK